MYLLIINTRILLQLQALWLILGLGEQTVSTIEVRAAWFDAVTPETGICRVNRDIWEPLTLVSIHTIDAIEGTWLRLS